MTTSQEYSLLLVDDEPSITRSLQRLLRREGYTIHIADGGPQALALLKELDTPVSLIISDQRMPEMTGAQFLEQAKTIVPDAVRFLLTGYAEMEAIVAAINRGEIQRYLTKPWNDEDLVLQVRQAIQQVELTRENRRLQEVTARQNQQLLELSRSLDKKVQERTREIQVKNNELQAGLMNTVRLLSSLTGSLNPALGRRLQAVATMAREVAAEMGLTPEQQECVEFAGLLHDIGLMGLGEDLWDMDEAQMNPDQRRQFTAHPMIGFVCLQAVPQLGHIADIVLSHQELYDGSGFPRSLRAEAIPLEARIVGAVADFCRIRTAFVPNPLRIVAFARGFIGPAADNIRVDDPQLMIASAMKQIFIRRTGSHYDPRVVQRLLARLETGPADPQTEAAGQIKAIEAADLKVGMVVAETIRTRDGRLVMASGTVLTKTLMTGIQKLADGKAIDSRFLVMGGNRP